MKSKQTPFPKINLSLKDFHHDVPENQNFELVIEFKYKDSAREFLNPLASFGIAQGLFKASTRNSEYNYCYPIKQIRQAYLISI